MPLEIAKAVYDRFASNDIDGFLSLCSPDIRWVVNGPASLEKCRTFEGIDGVREFLAILNRTWRFTAFVPREFIADRDQVVVLGEEQGHELSTAEPFHNRWAHVFTVRDGRVVAFREFLCHWTGSQTPPPMEWGAAEAA
ncbi:MAG: nuclear transport factor 2 family protein [Verrucomicrobiales bacterium]|nr:nuclear transport factor 2 family protein [Verrucomicrobiales bacterium]